ncbi:MAG: amidase family protein [Bauldia sp.]
MDYAPQTSLNPAVKVRFDVASRVTQQAYREALRLKAAASRRVRELLGEDGVLVLPTMPGIAPPLASSEREFEFFRSQALPMLCISGHSGCPQISLPMATVENCPLGLSLMAPPGSDRALIALARRILDE